MEDKKMKLKKGWLAVQVGLEDEDGDCDGDGPQRFAIPISYLYHPLFKRLLEKAHEVYGYHTTGPLRLPCSVDDFLHLRCRIEKESNHHSLHHHIFLILCLSTLVKGAKLFFFFYV
ncbi:Auxin-responsive protein [Quillaja saponaria]|uniref:Auxin-responsive protein n=1 Tax=Quillaja saponaria TaxID=32244 RepID=A0AAD7LH98_QUISA|nr:Auxin-responsive protein [Quillaja saponaria]